MLDAGALKAPMNWGERIKAAREAKDLSQKALGDAIGRSQVTIGEYERQETEPSLALFQKIADVTGFQFVWLVTGYGPPQNGIAIDENAVDRAVMRKCIAVAERIMNREGHRYSPDEKADAIFAGYAQAIREGGESAVEAVFERALAGVKK